MHVFVFLLQLRAWVLGYSVVPTLFAVFTVLVWLRWIVIVALSRRYAPWTDEWYESTSVIVPVVDEPLDLFRDVLTRLVEQEPTEILVVINGKRNLGLEAVCNEFDGVRYTWTETAGKRNAVRVGYEQTTGDVIVLVDSDTVWTREGDGTLRELLKPFKDPRVGGVTTRQRVLEPDRKFITRWADWLENSRAKYSMPAQSVTGHVGCLPGRTIAFRREVLDRGMDYFMKAEFLGTFLEVSDDRSLTNAALRQGFRTVYQSTSLVYTDTPLKLKKLYKQRLRWARGSQYNTLRMLPWMLAHAPTLAFFFILDIVLPFILIGGILGWVARSASGNGYNYFQPILRAAPGWQGWAWAASLAIVASWMSMAIRQMRHLDEKFTDFFRLPFFIMFSTLFLTPVWVLGFFRCAHAAGWGTRANSYDGDKRKLNPKAGVPYLIGFGLLAIEVLPYV